ncbi:MAG: hypoxanthine phosphoribosyltransferase [Clostridia bacterium]|nr:hypoxanthine phosphoribosyltransferase [Clostridia bacterium]
MDLHNDIDRILISEKEVEEIVTRIAKKVSEDYEGKKLLLLCILKGSVVFMGDLMKHISIPVQIDFMKVSSYGSGTTSGNLKIKLDLHRDDLDTTDILIVEDIIDSGKTLSALTKYLTERGAKSVRSCTLLDKPSRREVAFVPDYTGREIPDEFVVGYGLDYNEDYRALPFVGILKREVYEKK